VISLAARGSNAKNSVAYGNGLNKCTRSWYITELETLG
jgi:hypothetical protein